MAFWGIEVKPGRPYTHLSDHMRGRLHLSQATLGTGSSPKKSIVQCNIGDKSPIFLCTLLPERIESCQLNLEFEEDDEVTFSVVGPHSIHLSGFFLSDGQDAVKNDYESDSYGEDIAETETEDSTDYNTEDEYDDDFIDDDDDDDLDMFPTSRVPNVGVVIEEILDDEKPANGNVSSKRLKMSNRLRESDDDDDDNSQRKIVKNGTGVPVLESEDEDGFPISSSRKRKLDGPNTKAKAKEKTDKRIVEEAKKTAKDDFDRVTSFKRRFDTLLRDGKTERATGQPIDSSLPSTEVVPENNVKQKKKNKKKKKEQIKEGKAHETGNGSKSDTLTEDKIQPEEANTGDIDQDMLVTNEHDQKLTNEKSLDMDADRVADENHSKDKKKKRRKKKKKSNTQESEADGNVDQTVTDTNESAGGKEEKNEAKSSQVRTFPNGLVIEELSMGKPDGKRTSPGKKVSVHYIGKLKKNGKIFDSSIGRAPFKFRLGVGQVIKGWDVGVNGMRIGDKRKLTIPPAMGYGAQGAGEKIPPNSWLVFDIELVDVR